MTPLDAVLLVSAGLAIGVFGTLVGAGGGFILTPLLLLVDTGASPSTVTSISLAVVCLNAVSGSIAYARLRRTDYRSGVPFALATLPGSVIGAVVVGYVPRGLFTVIMAALLGVIAVWLLRGKTPHEQGTVAEGASLRSFVDSRGNAFRYGVRMRTGVLCSAAVGFLSSFLGIGGGIIHVPLLVQVLGFPVHVATATSHFVLAITSAAATVTHLAAGSFTGRSAQLALLLGVGVVAGAQLGAWLSHRVSGRWIQRLLAVGLLLLSFRLITTVV